MKKRGMKKRGILLMIIIVSAMMLILVGCASDSLNLEGMWSASDGTTKSFGSNGVCNAGNGGGPQTYAVSSNKDSKGYYTLVITRPFDEWTWLLQNSDADTVQVFDEAGNLQFTMTRK